MFEWNGCALYIRLHSVISPSDLLSSAPRNVVNCSYIHIHRLVVNVIKPSVINLPICHSQLHVMSFDDCSPAHSGVRLIIMFQRKQIFTIPKQAIDHLRLRSI